MSSLTFLEKWPGCVVKQAPLAPLTSLRMGGPAGALVAPDSVETLFAMLKEAVRHQVGVRFLGSGTNILVQDVGYPGLVIQFTSTKFQTIDVSDNKVIANTGVTLGNLLSTAARKQLGGLESLVGFPGTVGGALKNDLKVKTGPLSQYVSRVQLLDSQGKVAWHARDEIPIDQLLSTPDGAIILGAEFTLHHDQTESIIKRIRKHWIHTTTHQPLRHERFARLFRDPPGGTANQLIVKASVQLSKVGTASLSERDANYVVVTGDAKAEDVLQLMELVQSHVEERLGETLQPSLVVW